jgi:hypothetical protein
VQAGQLGPLPATALPDDPVRDLAALAELKPTRHPFVVRLTRLFYSGGDAGIAAMRRRALTFARRGYLVEIQVRYHPDSAHDGDVAGFASWVRRAVDVLGAVRGVIALQVTNEVNFPLSADSSDGAYKNARDALVRGVIAAKAEARHKRFRRLTIGFNWFYTNAPPSEQQLWSYLGRAGGPTFAQSVDWVGLDIYPGTFFPPVDTPGGERDAIVNALSALRNCYLPRAGIGASTPIHVEENGWPTDPPLRTYAQQVSVMQTMVRSFDDYRGTYDVSDYRWFNLRDADSSSLNFQQQYGLLDSSYRPKPAFAAYRRLVAQLSR